MASHERPTLNLKKKIDFPPKPPEEEKEFNSGEQIQRANTFLDSIKKDLYASGTSEQEISKMWAEVRNLHGKIQSSVQEYESLEDPSERAQLAVEIKELVNKLGSDVEEDVRIAYQNVSRARNRESGHAKGDFNPNRQGSPEDIIPENFDAVFEASGNAETEAHTRKQIDEKRERLAKLEVEEKNSAGKVKEDRETEFLRLEREIRKLEESLPAPLLSDDVDSEKLTPAETKIALRDAVEALSGNAVPETEPSVPEVLPEEKRPVPRARGAAPTPDIIELPDESGINDSDLPNHPLPVVLTKQDEPEAEPKVTRLTNERIVPRPYSGPETKPEPEKTKFKDRSKDFANKYGKATDEVRASIMENPEALRAYIHDLAIATRGEAAAHALGTDKSATNVEAMLKQGPAAIAMFEAEKEYLDLYHSEKSKEGLYKVLANKFIDTDMFLSPRTKAKKAEWIKKRAEYLGTMGGSLKERLDEKFGTEEGKDSNENRRDELESRYNRRYGTGVLSAAIMGAEKAQLDVRAEALGDRTKGNIEKAYDTYNKIPPVIRIPGTFAVMTAVGIGAAALTGAGAAVGGTALLLASTMTGLRAALTIAIKNTKNPGKKRILENVSKLSMVSPSMGLNLVARGAVNLIHGLIGTEKKADAVLEKEHTLLGVARESENKTEAMLKKHEKAIASEENIERQKRIAGSVAAVGGGFVFGHWLHNTFPGIFGNGETHDAQELVPGTPLSFDKTDTITDHMLDHVHSSADTFTPEEVKAFGEQAHEAAEHTHEAVEHVHEAVESAAKHASHVGHPLHYSHHPSAAAARYSENVVAGNTPEADAGTLSHEELTHFISKWEVDHHGLLPTSDQEQVSKLSDFADHPHEQSMPPVEEQAELGRYPGDDAVHNQPPPEEASELGRYPGDDAHNQPPPEEAAELGRYPGDHTTAPFPPRHFGQPSTFGDHPVTDYPPRHFGAVGSFGSHEHAESVTPPASHEDLHSVGSFGSHENLHSVGSFGSQLNEHGFPLDQPVVGMVHGKYFAHASTPEQSYETAYQQAILLGKNNDNLDTATPVYYVDEHQNVQALILVPGAKVATPYVSDGINIYKMPPVPSDADYQPLPKT